MLPTPITLKIAVPDNLTEQKELLSKVKKLLEANLIRVTSSLNAFEIHFNNTEEGFGHRNFIINRFLRKTLSDDKATDVNIIISSIQDVKKLERVLVEDQEKILSMLGHYLSLNKINLSQLGVTGETKDRTTTYILPKGIELIVHQYAASQIMEIRDNNQLLITLERRPVDEPVKKSERTLNEQEKKGITLQSPLKRRSKKNIISEEEKATIRVDFGSGFFKALNAARARASSGSDTAAPKSIDKPLNPGSMLDSISSLMTKPTIQKKSINSPIAEHEKNQTKAKEDNKPIEILFPASLIEDEEEKKRFEQFILYTQYLPQSAIEISEVSKTQTVYKNSQGKLTSTERGADATPFTEPVISIKAKPGAVGSYAGILTLEGAPIMVLPDDIPSSGDAESFFWLKLKEALRFYCDKNRHNSSKANIIAAFTWLMKYEKDAKGIIPETILNQPEAKAVWSSVFKQYAPEETNITVARLLEKQHDGSTESSCLKAALNFKLNRCMQQFGSIGSDYNSVDAIVSISDEGSDEINIETEHLKQLEQNSVLKKAWTEVLKTFYPVNTKYSLPLLLKKLGYTRQEDGVWFIPEKPPIFRPEVFAGQLLRTSATRRLIFVTELRKLFQSKIDKGEPNRALEKLFRFEALNQEEMNYLKQAENAQVFQALVTEHFPEKNEQEIDPVHFVLHEMGYIWNEDKTGVIPEEEVIWAAEPTVDEAISSKLNASPPLSKKYEAPPSSFALIPESPKITLWCQKEGRKAAQLIEYLQCIPNAVIVAREQYYQIEISQEVLSIENFTESGCFLKMQNGQSSQLTVWVVEPSNNQNSSHEIEIYLKNVEYLISDKSKNGNLAARDAYRNILRQKLHTEFSDYLEKRKALPEYISRTGEYSGYSKTEKMHAVKKLLAGENLTEKDREILSTGKTKKIFQKIFKFENDRSIEGALRIMGYRSRLIGNTFIIPKEEKDKFYVTDQHGETRNKLAPIVDVRKHFLKDLHQKLSTLTFDSSEQQLASSAIQGIIKKKRLTDEEYQFLCGNVEIRQVFENCIQEHDFPTKLEERNPEFLLRNKLKYYQPVRVIKLDNKEEAHWFALHCKTTYKNAQCSQKGAEVRLIFSDEIEISAIPSAEKIKSDFETATYFSVTRNVSQPTDLTYLMCLEASRYIPGTKISTKKNGDGDLTQVTFCFNKAFVNDINHTSNNQATSTDNQRARSNSNQHLTYQRVADDLIERAVDAAYRSDEVLAIRFFDKIIHELELYKMGREEDVPQEYKRHVAFFGMGMGISATQKLHAIQALLACQNISKADFAALNNSTVRDIILYEFKVIYENEPIVTVDAALQKLGYIKTSSGEYTMSEAMKAQRAIHHRAKSPDEFFGHEEELLSHVKGNAVMQRALAAVEDRTVEVYQMTPSLFGRNQKAAELEILRLFKARAPLSNIQIIQLASGRLRRYLLEEQGEVQRLSRLESNSSSLSSGEDSSEGKGLLELSSKRKESEDSIHTLLCDCGYQIDKAGNATFPRYERQCSNESNVI